MGANPQYKEEEFCSECGEFVESLNESTGWCDECSRKLGYVAPVCPRCHQPILNGLTVCSRYKCRHEMWLERNANSIELIMATQFVTVQVAKKIVRDNNRTNCYSCQQPIKGGQKGRHFFCTKNPECVKAHNSYSYHIRNKPHEEALQLAITASMIYKLTKNISNRKPQTS